MDKAIWVLMTLGAAAPAGVLVARASVELPRTIGLSIDSARPRRYLICILACVALAAWSVAVSPGPRGAVGALMGCFLVLIALVDWERLWLPIRLTVPLGLLGLAEAAALEPATLPARLVGAAAGFACLWLLAAVYLRVRKQEGLGGGDPYLLGAAGAWVGWLGLPTVLLVASLGGLALAALKRLFRRQGGWKDEAPFGTYLAVGLWIAWLYGPFGLG